MNEEWIFYNDLFEKCSNSENKILLLLRTGKIQPYDANEKPFYCPEEYTEWYHYTFVDKDRPPETQKRIKEISNREPNLHEFSGYHPDQFKKMSWEFVRAPVEDPAKWEELFSIIRKIQFKKSEVNAALKYTVTKGNAPKTRKRAFTKVMKRAIQHYRNEYPDRELTVEAIQDLIKNDHDANISSMFDPDGVIEKVVGKNIFQLKKTKGDEKKKIDKPSFRKRFNRLIKKDKTNNKNDR